MPAGIIVMEKIKDRTTLSPDASLLLDALEAVSTGAPLTVKVGKSPEHPSRLEAACSELARSGHLEPTSNADLLSEYKFG